jgi:hypothetical protein
MSQTATLPVLEDEPPSVPAAAGDRGRLAALRVSYPSWIWAGVVLCALGFGLIVYTWARVAALLDVSLQLPYIVSGGFTSLALILVGLTLINVASKRQDAAERSRQLTELRELLTEMRSTMAGEH